MILKNFVLILFFSFAAAAQKYTETEIIYGRRDGMALTLTVIQPENSNGKGIISLLSGGYYSDHSMYDDYRDRALPFVDAGYTVFLAQHSSTPRYTIPDACQDIQTAVQYVRYNASKYKIDPYKIGITGTSSGGHLALLIATSDDIADASSKNPMDQVSSKVQAAAVFCPPTDFLNYGSDKHSVRENEELLKAIRVDNSFKYTTYDTKSDSFVQMDKEDQLKTDKLMSPAQLVTPDDPAILICHGNKDDLVPFQQAQLMIGNLKQKGIPNKLIEKDGAGHGWKNMNDDEKEFIKWFDIYLK